MALAGSIFISGITSKPARVIDQAALGPEELQSVAGAAAGAGFAERIDGRETGVFEQGILRVGSFAVVLQREAPAARRDCQRPLRRP